MPSFFQQAAKFLGFAAKKEAAPIIRAVEKEAAVAFEAAGPAWERTIKVRRGGAFVGNIGYKIDPSGKAMLYGSVVAPEFRGRGFGKSLYEKAIADAKAMGANMVTSDVTGTTEEAAHVWEALGRKGYEVEQFEIKPGKKGYRLSLTDEVVKSGAMTKEIMKLGQGNSGTSELKRSIKSSVHGSRTTSRAL